MSYAELAPPPELRPWIHSFWTFRVEADAGEIEHHIPLTGGAMLSVRAHEEPLFIGPRVAPLTTPVRGGEEYWGVHFVPAGARPLLGLGVGSLREEIVPLRVIGPGIGVATTLEDGLRTLAEGVLRMTERVAQPDSVVAAAVAAIVAARGVVRIVELAQQSNLSGRHFRRRFFAESGLTPKELARLRRLRSAAAASIDGSAWADLASDAGFADQPHLVREFQTLIGTGPELFRRHATRIRHQLLD